MIRWSCTFISWVSRVILPRALKSVLLKGDKALFLWKKKSWLVTRVVPPYVNSLNFVEVTETSQLSSQVSIYICLACFALAALLVAFYYTLEAIHSASEAISTEFLRLRKTRALHSGLKQSLELPRSGSGFSTPVLHKSRVPKSNVR